LPSAEQSLPPGTYTNQIEQGGVPSNLTVLLIDSFNTKQLDQAYARNQIVKLLLTIRTEEHDEMLRRGFFFTREFPILSNTTELRVMARDDGNGKIGSVHIPLASAFLNKAN
jgi:hypothetical protein